MNSNLCVKALTLQYTVISIVSPIELYFLIGFVNKLYDILDDVHKRKASTIRAKDWSDKLGPKDLRCIEEHLMGFNVLNS